MSDNSHQDWLETARRLAAEFETRAADHDASDAFVAENYAALKKYKFFSAAVPEELGGGGVAHSTMCDILRVLAGGCSSTALALSMHQHLLAANLWKYRQGQGGEAMLEKIAKNQPVLVSTGARDWLESNGEMIATEGGFRVKAVKFFASQSEIGDVLVTSAPYHDPEAGSQVLHFPVPMNSEGVTVMNDWRTLGMRGTGSHTVQLDNVFIPESSIVLRRPQGEFHPVWNVVLTVAMPMIMSVYLGVAQKAAGIAVETVRGQKNRKSHAADGIGAMMNELTCAELHLKDMVRIANDLDFEPADRNGQDILSRKTNVANACMGVVSKAMELVGGQGFYRRFGLERLFRDVQGAKYHPLQQRDQQQFLGEFILEGRNSIL